MTSKGKQVLALGMLLFLLVGCDLVTGNLVWDDLNQDGIQDPGEPGLAGVTVNLYRISSDPNDPLLEGVTVTDSLGFYEFEIPANDGEYFFEFVLPDGYVFSPQFAGDPNLDSDADPNSGYTIDLSFDQDDNSIDAGMYLPEEEEDLVQDELMIGDFVWYDSNANGIQDEDEDGAEGVEVLLSEISLGIVTSQNTSADGWYSFGNLASGDYQLEFIPPPDFTLTSQDQGGDDAIDSDPDPIDGLTDVFTLGPNDDFDMDAGLIQTAGPEDVAMCYGPDPEDFPEGYSPLTGQPVADPSLLALRPVFVSISLFPPSVRPPTGLSITPVVYQFYIGDGDTRLLAAFHGEFPEITFDPGQTGVDNSIPDEDEMEKVIGDWVWFDMNGNSVQDDDEPGVPRIPVTLYVNGKTFATIETDDNGYYYFSYDEVENPQTLQLKFEITNEYEKYYFVAKGAGNDDSRDSDVYVEGFTDILNLPIDVDEVDFRIDAGLRRSTDRIEGVRSGRVFFEDIRQQYCGCVITAGADPTVAAQIQTCAFAASTDEGNIGASGVDITQLGNIAQHSTEGSACNEPNLSGNLFCTETPPNGQAGDEVYTFWNINNRDHFIYNPAMSAYNWYKNIPSDNETFEIMTDRLTGESLSFENVVIMLVNMTQINEAGTIFEMDLQTNTGLAYVFRNGQMFETTWSTINGPYEQSTGLLRPYRFLDMDGNPFPFAPGQTWVNMLHSFHGYEEIEPGVWRARFYAPPYNP